MGIIDQIGLFIEQDENRELKIYCDMDSVLTDWEKAFQLIGDERTKGLTTREFEDKYGLEETWKLINGAGEAFWSEMPWLPDGKKLWNYIKPHNPTILSSPAKSKVSKTGKHIWIDRELGKGTPRILKREKWEEADPESVLIDDYNKKIDDWVNKGDGIGILHTSADKTIAELKKLGL